MKSKQSIDRKQRIRSKNERNRIRNIAAKNNKKKEDMRRTDIAIKSVYSISLLILRNQGWGKVRLGRFSEKFDQMLTDVHDGLITLDDIIKTVESETKAAPGEYDIIV